MEIGRFNGWRILGHPVFRERYLAQRSEARRLASTRPVAEARQHPTIKLFAAVNQILTDVIPADPDAPDFRLRDELAMFRRVKGHGLPDRYRLFFVFSSARRVIIVLYLNDDSSLRKEGGRTDPYARFSRLVERGQIGQGVEPNLGPIVEQLSQDPPTSVE